MHACTSSIFSCAKDGDDVVIKYHRDVALNCTLCVITGVPVPTAQALWLSNQTQAAGTAAWHRHWQLDSLWTSSAAVVILSVLHAQRTHTSLPLVNRYRLQFLIEATSDCCHEPWLLPFTADF